MEVILSRQDRRCAHVSVYKGNCRPCANHATRACSDATWRQREICVDPKCWWQTRWDRREEKEFLDVEGHEDAHHRWVHREQQRSDWGWTCAEHRPQYWGATVSKRLTDLSIGVVTSTFGHSAQLGKNMKAQTIQNQEQMEMMVLVDLRIVSEEISDVEQMTTQRRKKEHDNAGDGAAEDSESANEARAGVEESSSMDGCVVVSRKSGKKECPIRSGRTMQIFVKMVKKTPRQLHKMWLRVARWRTSRRQHVCDIGRKRVETKWWCEGLWCSGRKHTACESQSSRRRRPREQEAQQAEQDDEKEAKNERQNSCDLSGEDQRGKSWGHVQQASEDVVQQVSNTGLHSIGRMQAIGCSVTRHWRPGCSEKSSDFCFCSRRFQVWHTRWVKSWRNSWDLRLVAKNEPTRRFFQRNNAKSSGSGREKKRGQSGGREGWSKEKD